MTKTALSLNLPQGSEFAGVLARTSGDLLCSAHDELTALLGDLEDRHPLRRCLGEIRTALHSALELNRQLTHCLELVALQTNLDGPHSFSPVERPPQVAERTEPEMVALIVESDDGLRSLMGEVIRRQGYRVLEASTAEEAERVAAETPFPVDKLVTEVLISGASGVALGSRLRVLRPGIGIVYTVCEAHEDVVPRGALGHDTVLKKPFTVAGLSDALNGAATV